ncbi:MtrAB system histidine kinase MtrB [Allobranchiibius sp. GilTou38]|uniref:MtrAB system histidine kinase MtrB n=1 Tax=Allobranchiibius sp. GilTou38 TaxID=2815210 RepID=UPI001AA1C6B3|nr:MtrAB system histidine kinase MtrB [Allobranchiibius sp. GilTou38]MBO1765672.1 HAMP domain-containing histidine kinase [Allobranchiibius sp. GilTou38]
MSELVLVTGARRSRAGRAWRFVRRTWRRSIHARVITITVTAGVLLTFVLGSYMYQRIADGLMDNKVHSAEQDALSKRAVAQGYFSANDKPDRASLESLVRQTVQSVASPGDDLSRRVIFEQGLAPVTQRLSKQSTGPKNTVVPKAMQEAVAKDPTHQQTQIVTVPRYVPRYINGVENGSGIGTGHISAVMVGSQVVVPGAGVYDLYLVYPMDTEEETLGIVKSAFAVGGILLILMLASLAYLVTRLVVAPVRSAAHVAERLSDGALNERMPVRGEDDLARLATSFNAMADSLQRQIRQLEDLSTLQKRFTSDVSHELRTPLTTIRMAADMLHDRRADFAEPVARSAELLNRELDRFETLLTDLLEISRFDAGASSLQDEPVDIRDIVRRVCDGYESLATRNHTRLRVHGRRPAVAPMDRRRVERIVRNLVSNAIEHSEGRPIDITVGSNSTAVAVSVRDYGVGLAPGDSARVFNRFWRADPARARTTGGSGLGLSISLDDARLHDGWLQAWGEPGQGACFRLTLPAKTGVPIARSPLNLAPDDSAVGRIMPQADSLTIGTRTAPGSTTHAAAEITRMERDRS